MKGPVMAPMLLLIASKLADAAGEIVGSYGYVGLAARLARDAEDARMAAGQAAEVETAALQEAEGPS